MLKKIGVVFFLILCASPSWALTVGGYTFSDYAFATTLIASTGSFTTSGGSLSEVLTDKDAGTYAYYESKPASVTLGFASCNIVNGTGADIVLFELGTPSGFKLNLNGIDMWYTTADTGRLEGRFPLTAVAIDLNDFDIGSGALLSSLWIGMDYVPYPSLKSTLSLVGALHCTPVPIPPSGWLFAPVLGVFMGIKRRFFTAFR